MKYIYSIKYIDEENRWIFLSSNDELELEEPNSFIFLLKKIRSRVEGHIIEVGEMCYKIPEDGLGLNYQWDTLFGITVICPQDIDLEATIDFLLSIN